MRFRIAMPLLALVATFLIRPSTLVAAEPPVPAVEDQVRNTGLSFIGAIKAGDYAGAKRLYRGDAWADVEAITESMVQADALRKKVEAKFGELGTTLMNGLEIKRIALENTPIEIVIAVGDVTVNGDAASVIISRGGAKIDFKREAGEWRVTAAPVLRQVAGFARLQSKALQVVIERLDSGEISQLSQVVNEYSAAVVKVGKEA